MYPSLDQIVVSGACIGCGLCAGVSGGSVQMAFTPDGRLRPAGETTGPINDDVAAACPGTVVAGLSAAEIDPGAHTDPIWGVWNRACYAWAADPLVRDRASTGGVLSALAAHMLNSGSADFILHVGPDPDRPARSLAKISQTPDEAANSGGSRYGPAAPLAALPEAHALVKNGKRFAFIGKPCDVSAIRLLAGQREWLAQALVATMTLYCGGASNFSKTQKLLDSWGLAEEELTELRYRGWGNPGPTTATTVDGRKFSTTYLELWEDEGTWDLQHRCKICPDAIGMAADIAAADCWPGGAPVGEDEGFNFVMTRTSWGDAIVDAAVADGALVLGDPLGPEDFENFQPHQSRKRRAVWARLAGQRAAGAVAPVTHGLGIEDLARLQPLSDNLRQARGTRKRARAAEG